MAIIDYCPPRKGITSTDGQRLITKSLLKTLNYDVTYDSSVPNLYPEIYEKDDNRIVNIDDLLNTWQQSFNSHVAYEDIINCLDSYEQTNLKNYFKQYQVYLFENWCLNRVQEIITYYSVNKIGLGCIELDFEEGDVSDINNIDYYPESSSKFAPEYIGSYTTDEQKNNFKNNYLSMDTYYYIGGNYDSDASNNNYRLLCLHNGFYDSNTGTIEFVDNAYFVYEITLSNSRMVGVPEYYEDTGWYYDDILYTTLPAGRYLVIVGYYYMRIYKYDPIDTYYIEEVGEF